MKIVREHINEKFIEDSDSIKDMGIGLIPKIKAWISKQYSSYYRFQEYDFNNKRCLETKLPLDNIIINDDLSIDIIGWVDFSGGPITYPDYITLNHIHGDFSCCFPIKTYQQYMPKKVGGEIRYYVTGLDALGKDIEYEIINKIASVCDVNMEKIILKDKW